MRSFLLLLPLVLATSASAGVRGYYQFPAINGDSIVFAAEGDLWRVPRSGGMALRITTHDGDETMPRFSPDGKWLAFSAQYEGNTDVYVVPAAGGEPTRLTFHPGSDGVVGWTSDSREVVFRSRRHFGEELRLYTVDRDGGMPEHINIGIASLASFSPDGRFIAFNRLSREFRNWKRYRGGTSQDIWLGDLERGEFSKLTDFDGTDRFPMWHDGRVFYLSDASGRLNIHSMRSDGSDVRQHTDHVDYDARWPSLFGDKIAYMYAGDIWVYDIEAGRTAPVNIELPSDRIRMRTRFEHASETLDSYLLNEDGSRMVISSRGELWSLPVSGGRTIAINETSGVRERAPAMSPDGDTIAAITDQTGEQEIVLFDAWGPGTESTAPRLLTRLGLGWIFQPVWSPDGTHIAFGDLTQSLSIVDVETGEVTRVDGDSGWEISEYTFSPDGKWLAYTRPFASWSWDTSIYLYSIETGESFPVTTRWTGDSSPTWDPSGEYLYFVSSRRLNPKLGDRDFQFITTETFVPCAVVLRADGVPPFVSHEIRELHGFDDFEDEATDDGDEEAGDETIELPEVVVDPDGIQNRVYEFPVPARYCFGLHATDGRLFYASTDVDGLLEDFFGTEDWRARLTLHVFDMESQEEETFLSGIRSYTFSNDGSTIAWRDTGTEIHVGSTDGFEPEPDESIDPDSLRLGVVPTDEFAQIFWEAWRLQRDFYWADNMAGVDWDSVGAAYAKLLPRISTRDELNDLIGQMIAELGTSHTYVWGGDDPAGADWVGVGLLGAELVPDEGSGAYRIQRILRPEAWETQTDSPLTAPYAGVRDGDYIFAINGRPVRSDENIFAHLANLAGEEVLLTIGSNADGSDTADIQVTTIDGETELRYRDWCRRNREYVAEASSGRIGYLHIPDMGGQGLVEFIKGFYPQLEKDALIIDCRYNGGGFVSQMIIERLARKQWAYMKPRRGKTDTYPSSSHVGPKVMLTNYLAGSDGDIGPESFQMLELGPVIGTRSWGGVVGIRADKAFVDGGMSTQPEFAWWEPRRGWDLENSGVYPDIVLDILPGDYAAGRDPQLDRAIDHLMQQLEQNPVRTPTPPAYPDKSLKIER